MEMKMKFKQVNLTKLDVNNIIKAIFDNGKVVIQEDELDTAAVGFINSFECRLFWNYDNYIYIQPYNPEHMTEVREAVDERRKYREDRAIMRTTTEYTITLTEYVCYTE